MPACAPARRGAALFQLLLTIGLVAAALIGLMQAQSVEAASRRRRWPRGRAAHCCRQGPRMAQHLLVCLTPGLCSRGQPAAGRIAALAGAPRPHREARRPAAHPPCRRSAGRTARNRTGAGTGNSGQPPCQRTAAEPPLCAALPAGLPGAGLDQATGINSVLAYVVNILNQAGLPGASANMADVG
jgi:hypothetical protein